MLLDVPILLVGVSGQIIWLVRLGIAFTEKGKTMTKKELKLVTSCEDEKTQYLEYPDGLRLIFHEGKYVGWYVTENKYG